MAARRWLVCVGLAASPWLAAGCGYRIPEELRAAAAQDLEEASRRMAQAGAEWRAALARRTELRLGAEGEACPVDLAARLDSLRDDYSGERGSLRNALAAPQAFLPFGLVDVEQLATAVSPLQRVAQHRLEVAELILAPDQEWDADDEQFVEYNLAQLHEVATDDFWTWDAVAVLEDELSAWLAPAPPQPDDGRVVELPPLSQTRAFEPGTATGRGYVYSYAEGRIICTSVFLVRNSTFVYAERVGPVDEADFVQSLDEDLRVEALRAALHGMRPAVYP